MPCDDDAIACERRGPLAVIRLERPEALNALTYPMIAAIERAARAAEADPAVVALCITGAGRGFCAGIDMGRLAEATQHGPRATEAAGTGDEVRPPALFGFLREISKPVIAAVNGVAAGGGFVLAMMCDLRFLAEDARLTTVFARRGLIAEHGTAWLLPRLVGLGRALDLLWSARPLDAAEAQRIGLADRVLPAAQLLDAAQAYAEQLAASVSPRALATIKAQVLADLERPFGAAARDAEQRMRLALRHPDAAEGAASYLERRPPRFAAWTGDD